MRFLEDYIRFLSEDTVTEIQNLVSIIYDKKHTPRSSTYRNAVVSLLKQYPFFYDGAEDTTTVSIQVYQDLFLEHVTVNADHIIGFAKHNIVVFPEVRSKRQEEEEVELE